MNTCKNPDKIYVAADSELGFKNTKTAIAYSFEQKFDTVEYIRKDALLEVIATAREAAVIQKNFNNCPVEQEARIDAYDYIMNKIESL